MAERPKSLEGVATWSESIMALHFDEGLRNGFSLRLSRYPDVGVTWVWFQAIADGVLYSYVNTLLPCAPGHKQAGDGFADYDVPGLAVRMMRGGPSAEVKAISFSADLAAQAVTEGRPGGGAVPIQLQGLFYPGPPRTGSPAGRFERSGAIDAELRVGGHGQLLHGAAKAHEQTQTNPRFGVAFTYAMLWSPTASMTALLARNRFYGDFQSAASDSAIKAFQVDAPGPTRRFAVVLDDGRAIEGHATTHHAFEVPVYDRTWRGHVVSAEAGGHRLVGMINDWKPEEQPYGV